MTGKWIKILYIISGILLFLSLMGRVYVIAYGIMPKFSKVQSVRILRIENENAFISLIVEVENRSAVPFSIISSDMSVFDANQHLGKVLINNNVRVPGNSSSIIKFQMSIPLTKIKEIHHKNLDNLYIQLQGACDLKMLGIYKKVMINQELSVLFSKMIEEYVFRIFQNSVYNENANLNPYTSPKTILIPLTFRNESGVDVNILDMTSKVSVNKLQCGSGNISNEFLLENNIRDKSMFMVCQLNGLDAMQISNPINLNGRNEYSIESLLKLSFWEKIYTIRIELNGEIK
ncbi:MAG TPA: hypothetical protein PKJ08_07695 [Candidatus Cloacimonadota bacterium]|nr:hypothetical protein [Candidatus Cloacimonadota bacterium]HPM01769.1 hypothetical protein [Candidatus Cloacimonadota bacterium]